MSLDTTDWILRAGMLRPEGRAFIDGGYVDAADGATFACVTPRDGTTLARVAACSEIDVDRAVRGARAAFESGVWSEMAPKQRRLVMLRMAALIDEHADELALLESLDMGKGIRNARNDDIPGAVRCYDYYANAIDKLPGEVMPTDPGSLIMVVREPLGVVGAVVPWNFPLVMAAYKVAPAIAMGNSVVVKPAEQSSLSMIRFAELAVEAGLSPGVLQVVPGFGEAAGQALGRHMDVDAIAFTGSAAVGKQFMRYSGESNMKRVSLECGGKTPHVVMPDFTNLDAAADAIAWGILYNQGEICNAGSRLIVHESIKDELLERVVAVTRQVSPGDPLDPATEFGAIVDEAQLATVLGYIDIGRAEGATVVTGGHRARVDSGGCYVEPTVLDGVRNSMRIAQEEIFGPVLGTIAFGDDDDPLAIANDSIYGLTAAVWTSDISTAHRSARKLRGGFVWVNCFDKLDISLPWGGFKQSGFGRDKGMHALEKYSDLKTIWVDLN